MDGAGVFGRALPLQEIKITTFSFYKKQKPFLLSKEERVFVFQSEALVNRKDQQKRDEGSTNHPEGNSQEGRLKNCFYRLKPAAPKAQPNELHGRKGAFKVRIVHSIVFFNCLFVIRNLGKTFGNRIRG